MNYPKWGTNAENGIVAGTIWNNAEIDATNPDAINANSAGKGNKAE